MQTCVTKGWWQVRKYWVLQRKRGMNRGNLVNGCWPGLIIAAHKSCVSATPQPLERFLFRYLYKLLILLLHGTQSGYLHAGAKPESSVKADINRYSNWDFYSFSFSFTAARIPLQINYPRVIFFWRLCQTEVRLFLHVLSMSWWIWMEQVRQPNYAWDVKWKSTCKPYLTLSKRP